MIGAVEARRGLLRWLAVPAALLVQATLVPSISLLGIQPSILLTVFVLFAFRNGALAATWMGFCCGLVLDTYAAGRMGAFSFALSLVGYLAGQLHERKVHVGYPLRVSILGLSVIVHDTAWHLVNRHGWNSLPMFVLRTSLPGALYSMLLGAILFAIRPPRVQARNW
jgi:rod shape-determining protein MreD